MLGMLRDELASHADPPALREADLANMPHAELHRHQAILDVMNEL